MTEEALDPHTLEICRETSPESVPQMALRSVGLGWVLRTVSEVLVEKCSGSNTHLTAASKHAGGVAVTSPVAVVSIVRTVVALVSMML